MKAFKKYWYVLTLLFVTLGLGVVTYLTSQKLTQTSPVAPNVAQQKPRAVSVACTLQFSIGSPSGTITTTPITSATVTPTTQATATPTQAITNTPTKGPTATPTTASNTPTGTITVTTTPTNGSTATPTNGSTATPTKGPTATPTFASNTPTGTITVTATPVVFYTPTPTGVPLAGVSPTEALPETPVSGSPALLGLTVSILGIVLLLIGFAF